MDGAGGVKESVRDNGSVRQRGATKFFRLQSQRPPAGVFVHQHTRLLRAGLRERADGTRAEDVRTSSRLQQLLEQLDAKYSVVQCSTYM